MMEKRRTWRKWLLRLLAVGLLFVLILGGTMFYFYKNQDKLITPLVNQINNQLNVEVDVKDIHLSFRQFPNVSVAFRNVFIPEAVEGSNDTLISADAVYLIFKPWDLWRDEVKISSIRLENGLLSLKIFKDGSVNYRFWKSDEEDESTFSVGLKDVEIRSVHFRYEDYQSKIAVADYIEEVSLSGNFASERLRVSGKGKAQHKKLSFDDFDYNLPVKVYADFLVEKEGEHILISSKSFQIDGLPVSLKILLDEHQKDFHITGSGLSASKIKTILPDNFRDALSWFDLEGKLDLEFAMTMPDEGKSERHLIFALHKGLFTFLDRDLRIRDVDTRGELHFGTDVRSARGFLDITEFTGKMDGGSFSVVFSLEDFERPLLALKADAKISLANLLTLAGMDTLENVKGDAVFDVAFENRFQSLKKPVKRDFISAQAGGSLHISDGAFNFKGGMATYEGISARCKLVRNDLQLDFFDMKTGKSDFKLSGQVQNLLPFLLVADETIYVDADLHSRHIMMDEILAIDDKASPKSDEYHLVFPRYVQAKLRAQIDTFDFGKFHATSCTGNMQLSKSGLKATFKNVRALDGLVENIGIQIDGTKIPYALDMAASGQKLNMNQMFNAFNNFGQDVITSKELYGTLTAGIRLRSSLTTALDIPLESIEADADVRIDNGRLVNFAPMEALSRFAKMEELSDVRFSRLSNTLRIKSGQIYIPAMDIRSNVIDLELEGVHSFENEIDYLVRMDLREVLFAERKRRKKDFEDIMVISSEGGARLWVTMKGHVTDPEIALYNRQIRQTIGEQLKEQGRQLRNPEEPKKQKQYEFEWEEED